MAPARTSQSGRGSEPSSSASHGEVASSMYSNSASPLPKMPSNGYDSRNLPGNANSLSSTALNRHGSPARPGSRPDPYGLQRHSHPFHNKSLSSLPSPQAPLIMTGHEEWRGYPALNILLRGIPHQATTWDLWRSFSAQGNVVFCELNENLQGQRSGMGRILFEPPPQNAFWSYGPYSFIFRAEDGREKSVKIYAEIDKKNHGEMEGLMRSPVRKDVRYAKCVDLQPRCLDFGVRVEEATIMTMATIEARAGNPQMPHSPVNLRVHFYRRTLTVTFPVDYERRVQPVWYKFVVKFAQLKKIYRMSIDSTSWALVIALESPPAFYRKRDRVEDTHSAERLTWSEKDLWFRTTEILHNPGLAASRPAPLCLIRDDYEVDIGRWTAYRLVIGKRQNDNAPDHWPWIQEALRDFNIETETTVDFVTTPSKPCRLWDMLDVPAGESSSAALALLHNDAHFMLPFDVRYQLEACISQGAINEHNITAEFLQKLSDYARPKSRGSEQPDESGEPEKSAYSDRARMLLEFVADRGTRVYNPMAIFNDRDAVSYYPKTRIPHYCDMMRKVQVTPATLYVQTPSVETSNRIIRKYKDHNDRFLRVQFTDELFEGRISSRADHDRDDELFNRVYRALLNGIRIGDRHYQFLAFGNSQLRENGAYFFCPTDDLSCDDIRKWMGDFHHIKVVAKYAARLGQCFSTTREIRGISVPQIKLIADVEEHGYCFTDGVGKISRFLAEMIATELKLNSEDIPSAFQFRLGGCKGVLAISPDASPSEVHIRQSQEKFKARYNGLEIIRWSQFSVATLNRQTITILECLGVPASVLDRKIQEQIANYDRAMVDQDVALDILGKYIDENQMTLTISQMILGGFMESQEPFVITLLNLWRAWSMKLLKEKARIIVDEGAFVLGIVDEFKVLKGYSKYPTKAGGLPQIFLQIPDKNSKGSYKIITGTCFVGRNPSLHPGDIRVVEAVDRPELRMYRNVVVFPTQGDRDIPSMCSGGDVDGDDYFVIWDKELVPREWNVPAMEYAAPKPPELKRPVGVKDLMQFFVRFMKNDSLPFIAHSHLAQADRLEPEHAKHPKCLELAALHSKAVDYVKTGEPAQMTKNLSPRDYPHFMEKMGRSYRSRRALGILYDRVQRVDFKPEYDRPFDQRILERYGRMDNGMLKKARQLKSQYDTAVRRLMGHREIKTEFEIWSTFIMSRPRVGSDYKLQEDMGRESRALKERFRDLCTDAAGSRDFGRLGPFVAAMYTVTQQEVRIALHECRHGFLRHDGTQAYRRMEAGSMPLISFPWIFDHELRRIAAGSSEPRAGGSGDDDHEAGFEVSKQKRDGRMVEVSASNSNNNSNNNNNNNNNKDVLDDINYIRTSDGRIIHHGEELNLFGSDESDEDTGAGGTGDDDETRRALGAERERPEVGKGVACPGSPPSAGPPLAPALAPAPAPAPAAARTQQEVSATTTQAVGSAADEQHGGEEEDDVIEEEVMLDDDGEETALERAARLFGVAE